VAHYASYEPEAIRQGPPIDAALRPATHADIDGLTAIDITVVVRTAEDWSRAIDKTLEGERLLLVAEIAGTIGAFAQAHRLDEHPVDHAPAGFYLTGFTVLPSYRRASLAREFTLARLAWIKKRADEAWYFAAAENTASIRLHQQLGFVEVARAPSIHGVAFDAAEGVLFRRALGGPTAGPVAPSDA
jgi:ribosomal protein S18 acetylase RimI-like enzyme